MELTIFGQILNVLPGTAQDLGGFGYVYNSVHNEVSEVGDGQRHLFTDLVQH